MANPMNLSRSFRAALLVAFALMGPAVGAQDPEGEVRQRTGSAPSDDAFRMGSPAQLPEGMTEEQMWPAASAEGWKKPVLVQWQRSFSDAWKTARERNMPLMVVVNMDGEIASEHFAGVRYRDPATAAHMARYVCVIASVYRHTPRDYDERGERVLCPRFGSVTCGEHIEAERELYAKYFEGKRISPRHIVLDLEGQKVHDVFFSWDTQTVLTTFVRGAEGWDTPEVRGDRSLAARVASADIADRVALEELYEGGDKNARTELLEALAADPSVAHVEVVRKALFGYDLELAGLARKALAKYETEEALDVVAEALKVPLDEAERRPLLETVARMAGGSKRAQALAALHEALRMQSTLVDAAKLGPILATAGATPISASSAAARAENASSAEGALAFGEALVQLGWTSADRDFRAILVEDARAALERVDPATAPGRRAALASVLAATVGDSASARRLAVDAVEAGVLAELPVDDGPRAFTAARALLAFADARQRAIRDAYRAGRPWRPEWLADAIAANAALAGTEVVDLRSATAHIDFLRWIGATANAAKQLDAWLERAPFAEALHTRLVERLLWDGGPAALVADYETRLARATDGESDPRLEGFAGYAFLVAAEHHRRRNEFDAAHAAYGRALELHASQARHPEHADAARHYQCLALAGRARLALEAGELAASTTDLLAALSLRPESATAMDGLSLTPLATGLMLHARLLEAGDTARADELQRVLDAAVPVEQR